MLHIIYGPLSGPRAEERELRQENNRAVEELKKMDREGYVLIDSHTYKNNETTYFWQLWHKPNEPAHAPIVDGPEILPPPGKFDTQLMQAIRPKSEWSKEQLKEEIRLIEAELRSRNSWNYPEDYEPHGIT